MHALKRDNTTFTFGDSRFVVLPTIKMLVGPKITLEKSIFFYLTVLSFKKKAKKKKHCSRLFSAMLKI